MDEKTQEFQKKREELKKWLYGTVWKQYDTEETALTVMEDIDKFFSDEWIATFLSSHYK